MHLKQKLFKKNVHVCNVKVLHTVNEQFIN